MNKHILVITDQNNLSTLALEKANEIALLFGSTVEVVSFIDSTTGDIDADTHDQVLKQHVQSSFDSSLSVSMQTIVTSDLCDWTKKHCSKTTIDLVIKTGHRSEKLFYTPTDWQLIRKLDCPLMIVSDHKWRAKARILATIDAGDTDPIQRRIDQEVLGIANHWAQAKQCALHAAYTMPLPAAKIELCLLEAEQFERENRAKAESLLHDRITQSNITDVECHIEFGSPEKRLASCANHIKADLVVLGSVGRAGLNGLLLGNTAEKVLHNLRTDVLIIKPQN